MVVHEPPWPLFGSAFAYNEHMIPKRKKIIKYNRYNDRYGAGVCTSVVPNSYSKKTMVFEVKKEQDMTMRCCIIGS